MTNSTLSANGTVFVDWPNRFAHVDQVLERAGPRTPESFTAGEAVKDFLRNRFKILVIGAGGLGCEILSNLALMGFKDIHVIDMDTIDISNLNRQFLFRQKDVGKPKATVAAEFIMKRVPGVKVTPYFGKIQDHGEDYYMQFQTIICGLDSVEARRWINATIVNMADEDNPDSYKPLIDGGTEGFRGQARVIFPRITSCYECSLDMLNKPTVFPICTIANTPRLPEHCIEWASVLEWPRVFKDKKLDTDDPEHIGWLFSVSSERAKQFKIEGVTWALTQGVVKNIIPAIASTNAIIAAACCNEAFKIATSAASHLNNYCMYIGTDGVYSFTFEHQQRPECPVCGEGDMLKLEVSRDTTVEQLIEMLVERQDVQVKKPSLSTALGVRIYWQSPAKIEEELRPNLEKKLLEFVPDTGKEESRAIVVTAKSLPFSLTLLVSYK